MADPGQPQVTQPPRQARSAGSGLVLGADGLARPRWASVHEDLRRYYDTEWGLPVRDEPGVFERLALEGFQSGLSWATILRRREGFRRAFAGFDPEVEIGRASRRDRGQRRAGAGGQQTQQYRAERPQIGEGW